jgi:hypothetical protein
VKNFTAFLLTLALVLLAAPSFSAPAGLSYTRPTQYTDGSPLPVGDITRYDIECVSFTPTGGTSGACPTISPTTLAGNATSGTVTLTIPAGGGAACFRLRTVVTSGATSDWSNTACKTFAPATPNPPGSVTVAVVIGITVTPVYKLAGGISRSTFVGFADLGVPCADRVEYSWRGHEFREIPRESVYWWEETTGRVVAPCAATG